jgi:hypothetical protein
VREASQWHQRGRHQGFDHIQPEPGLRPVDHRTEGRVDAHLFITVLAYQLVQLIRRRLRQQGISDRWSTLRDILAGQCRVTAAISCAFPTWRISRFQRTRSRSPAG